MWDHVQAIFVQWLGVVKDRLPRPSQALQYSVKVKTHISCYEKLFERFFIITILR